jgi:ABC-2 type transport system ATP-binding protein
VGHRACHRRWRHYRAAHDPVPGRSGSALHRLAVIDHGKLIAEGTSRELKASVGGNTLHVRLESAEQREAAETLLANVLGVSVHNGVDAQVLSAQVSDTSRVADAMAALASNGVGVNEFSLGQPTLDEVFFALTGHVTAEHSAEVKQ